MRIDLSGSGGVLMACLLTWATAAQAAPGLLPDPHIRLLRSNNVTHLAVQLDGGLIVGARGNQSVGGTDFVGFQPDLIRLDPQGRLDRTWNAPRVNQIYALASGPDGSVLVGGQGVGEPWQGWQGMVRLDASSGAIDTNWAASLFEPQAWAFAFDSDWVYAGGVFSVGDGVPRGLIRISAATGEVDASFAPQFEHGVQALAIGADGFVYAGGGFSGDPPQYLPHGRVSRVDANSGQVDVGWRVEANNFVTKLATDASGAVLVAGFFTEIGGQPRSRLAKLSANGSVLAWNPAPDHWITGLAVDGDHVYVAGRFSHIGGEPRAGLARLSGSTGIADPAWRGDLDGIANALVVDHGVVAVGGEFNAVGQSVRLGVAKLDPTNALAATSDDVAVAGRVRNIVPDGQGGYLVGGRFARANNLVRQGLLRLRPDLTLDPEWAPAVAGAIETMAVDSSSGRVYAGGGLANGTAGTLVRIDLGNGEVDGSWKMEPDGAVLDLKLRAGVLHVAGGFTRIAGRDHSYLARFQPGQVLPDPAWTPAPNDTVQALAFADDGAVFAGGNFTAIGGQPRTALARLNPANGSAAGWQSPISEGQVQGLSWQPDGSLYVDGWFLLSGSGYPRMGLAQFNAGNGSLDRMLAGYQGNAMHVTGDGAWVIHESPWEGLVRYSTVSGERDPDWSIRTEGNVYAISGGPLESLLVGGEFPTVGGDRGVPRWGLAAYADDVIFIDGFRGSPDP